MEDLRLDGETLTIEQLVQVAREDRKVFLCPGAAQRVEACRAAVDELVSRGEVVYGVTTGFGKFSDTVISQGQGRELQVNLVRSHAVGTGEPLPRDAVRAAVLLRANALARGYSGVRVRVINALIDLLNHGLVPVVPSQGSLGASGDLAPLAHIAQVLLGEGEVWGDDGVPVPAGRSLRKHNLKPLILGPKEGLALINGTQIMTALGALAVVGADCLANDADVIACLSTEVLRGIPDLAHQDLHALRPHPGQVQVASRLRDLLCGSSLVTQQGEIRVQDAYSIRCIPQVHGATRDVIEFARSVISREINSVTDNPLIFPSASGHHRVISGGNFHGQPLALALDALAMAIAELASISERRLDRLLNPHMNEDLPPFLTDRGGLESGMMLVQYTAAALVSENKVLCHPASVDTIPSSAGQEDHVSMGSIAARKVGWVLSNSTRVLGMELIAACQAAEFRGSDLLAPATAAAYHRLRRTVKPLRGDRSLAPDMERAFALLKDGHISRAAETAMAGGPSRTGDR